MVDRFMSKETVQIEKLQLLATGALFVAAKYEEVYSPSVKNYSYVTDGGYTEEEILTAERYILQVLQFDLSNPNPMNFLRRISKADDYDIETRTVGKYLLEISIMDHAFIGLKPSLCAAAAMFVSRKMLQRSDWNGTLIHYSGGYTKNDMKHVVEMILNYLTQPVAHEEFFKKYASKKYMKASILARRWAKKVEAENIDILAD
jgi:G2/mitotic-specific cyclin 1/2